MTVTPPRNEKKDLNKTTSKNPSPITAILVVIGIIVCALLVWWFCFNGVSLYSGDKSGIQTDIQALLDKVQAPSGKQLYSEVVDLGCDDRNSVGLETVIHCDFAGYKYYESQGDISSGLQSFDKVLTNEGWISYGGAPRADNSSSTSYIHTGSNSVAVIESNSLPSITPLDIQNLIKTGKISPDPGQTVFGVRITEPYWSCRGGTLLQLPCHFPPGKIN